jgi:hypothetical protein
VKGQGRTGHSPGKLRQSFGGTGEQLMRGLRVEGASNVQGAICKVSDKVTWKTPGNRGNLFCGQRITRFGIMYALFTTPTDRWEKHFISEVRAEAIGHR